MRLKKLYAQRGLIHYANAVMKLTTSTSVPELHYRQTSSGELLSVYVTTFLFLEPEFYFTFLQLMTKGRIILIYAFLTSSKSSTVSCRKVSPISKLFVKDYLFLASVSHTLWSKNKWLCLRSEKSKKKKSI